MGLHEAAPKGRTQLCAVLLAHGADPTLKNQEGQTPLDLASADDVKCLLQDAMPTATALPTTTKALAPPSVPATPISLRQDALGQQVRRSSFFIDLLQTKSEIIPRALQLS